MSPYRLRYTSTAAESIHHLHPSVKKAMREAIRGLVADPLGGHPLTLELAGFRSLPVSRYRVIYRLDETKHVLEIHLVGPRKDIYELFREFLGRARQP